MNTTATISNDSDGLGEQRLMEESDPITDEQRSEVQRWSYCCRLISKEAEHAVSNLHFAHVFKMVVYERKPLAFTLPFPID